MLDLGDGRLRLADQLGELGLRDTKRLAKLGETIGRNLLECALLGLIDAACALWVTARFVSKFAEVLRAVGAC